MCDKLLYLAQRAFISLSVRAEPLIHQGRIKSEREICQVGDKYKEMRGDITILGLLYLQAEATIDVKLVNTDTDS